MVIRISISRYTSNFFVSHKNFFLLLISVTFLLGACAPVLQTQALNKNSETVGLIVFVDTPFQTIDTGQGIGSFYVWIFEAFRYKSGQGIVIFDDKTVVSHAMAKGIKPMAILYSQNNPKMDIIHLAFDESQIEALYSAAKDLGATHLIKARLIANETTEIPRNQITSDGFSLGPIILNMRTTISGKFDQMVRVTTIEFSIYDVKRRELVLTKEFTTSETSMSRGLADYRVRDNLASAVIAALLSQSSKPLQIEPQKPTKIVINKMVKIEIPKIEGGYFLENRFVTLRSATLIDNNLLQYDLSFRDFHDDRLKIVLRRDANNKLATYIVDRFGIRYSAISSSLSGDLIDVRPGERKDIFFVFPIPATSIKHVNLYSTWDIQTPQRTHTFTLEFKDVPIP